MKDEYIQKYNEFYRDCACSLVEKHNNERKIRLKEIFKNYAIVLGISFFIILWTVWTFSFGSKKVAAVIIILGLPIFGIIKQYINPAKSSENEFKKLFINKFLSIFGTFEWKQGVFNANRTAQNDSVIFPQNFLLTYDDIIYGWYNDEFELAIQECKSERNSFLTVLPLLIPTIGCLLFSVLIGLFILCILTSVFGGISGSAANIVFGAIIFLVLFMFFKILQMVWSSINKGNFEGLVIECAMPKKFSGLTYFYESNPYTNKNVSREYENSMQKIILEDIEFNKSYNVFADNQTEARYILTTAFIQRLNNIKNIFNAKYIRAEFKNNKMTMLIQTGKDMFYFNQYKELTKNDFDRVFGEFCSLFEMIEYLKLNIKTGL